MKSLEWSTKEHEEEFYSNRTTQYLGCTCVHNYMLLSLFIELNNKDMNLIVCF
jgi:hypothetical protein